MKKIMLFFIFLIIFLVNFLYPQSNMFDTEVTSTGVVEQLTDDKMLSMLDVALKNLPEKVKSLPNNIRRVSFYSLKADRTQVSQPLLKQIQGKIEAAFTSLSVPITLVYSPEIKPVKIVAKDDTITFSSGFQSTEEIKNIAQKLRLDGLLEGEIYYTPKNVYLNLRIFDTETMAIVWSCELTNIAPPPPPPAKQKLIWYDIGFGCTWLPVENVTVSEDGGVRSVTKTAYYYNADLRLLTKMLFEERLKFAMSVGSLYLYEGINISTKTVVSSSKRGSGPNNLFVRIGFKFSLLQKEAVIPGVGKRDLLSTEIAFGNIFASANETLNIPFYSLRFESDITKEISVTLGLSYVPLTAIPNTGLRTGGFMYEVSIIRFILNP